MRPIKFVPKRTHRRSKDAIKFPCNKDDPMAMNKWRKEKYRLAMTLHFKNADKDDVFVAECLDAVKAYTDNPYARSQFIRRALYLLFKNKTVSLSELSESFNG
jgi:hypothetical protein